MDWLEPPEVDVPARLSDEISGHPLVVRALMRRGLVDPAAARAFLNPLEYSPTPPDELPGMQTAVECLTRAIQSNVPILVWGDFDVDGQTSTTVLVSGLQGLGARVDYHIPVRASESHGIKQPVLQRILESSRPERPGVLLSCDTGISAHQAVEYARQLGLQVVITDHHDLPPELPQADAIVNPKLLPEGHPLATLPGVGVAYKLVEALYGRAGRSEAALDLLDLVALGIVADLALLRSDTRYLLQLGLERLRRTQRLGLRLMMELADLEPEWLSEEHIGFVLAPRLNALGRLSDANPAVELFTTSDPARARLLALDLEGLNARRKLLTDQVYQGTLAQLEQDPSLLEHNVILLWHSDWPAGVLGPVASRLVERYHKPAILLASPPGEPARGSARSVEGVNITAAIDEAAHSREGGDLLLGFGGHPMAAGLSIEAQRLPELRRRLSRAVGAQLGSAPAPPSLAIDDYLPLGELSLEMVSELERLAPFGPGNPPLLLASRNLHITRQSLVGRSAEHLLLTVEDETDTSRRVVWWNGAGEPLPDGIFDLAYIARASTYRGQRDVQVEWVQARSIEDSAGELAAQRPALHVTDYRRQANPLSIARHLLSQPGVQVWCEADASKRLGGVTRGELAPCPVLAIFTIPPGPAELRLALQAAAPQEVILFADDPDMDRPDAFLERLAGLVKHALRSSGGQAGISALAAATAQRSEAVHLGIAWLAARGIIQIREQDADNVTFESGRGTPDAELASLSNRLDELLAEVAAYRAYFARADQNALVNLA